MDKGANIMTFKAIKEIITVSEGNTKTGAVASLSLPCFKTCAHDAPCLDDCYAWNNVCSFRPSVRKAWQKNLDSFIASPAKYMMALQNWLKKRNPAFFRYNIGGDIPNALYLDIMGEIAKRFPDTKFLAFTKKYWLVEHNRRAWGRPDNLTIVFSAWPGHPLPDYAKNYGIAWMQDGTEDRVPANAIQCPGMCDSCGMCWQLKKIGHDVVFPKH